MIDPLDSNLIPIREIPALLPGRRRGRKLNNSTVWRWINKGYGKNRIKLEIVRQGVMVFTTRKALAEFFAAITAAAGPGDDSPGLPIRTPAQRKKDHERATQKLAKAGI